MFPPPQRVPRMRTDLFALLTFVGAILTLTPPTRGLPTIRADWAIVGEYDAGFNFITATPDFIHPITVGHHYQVQFRFRLNGLGPNEDFAGMKFNIASNNSFLQVEDFGSGPYAPVGGTYDSNGVSAGGIQSHWMFNGDPSLDLFDVQVSVGAAEAGNRQYGESVRPAAGSADLLGYPTVFGEVFYAVTASQYPFFLFPNEFLSITSFQIWTNNTVNGGGTLVTIPEPGVMFPCAILAILLQRRRFQS